MLKKFKKIRASQLSFDKKIYIKKGRDTDDNIDSRVASELKKFQFYRALKPIYDLAASDGLPSRLVPLYGAGREHYEIIDVVGDLGRDGYLYWILGVFKKCGKSLRKFNSLRGELNSCLLNNQPVQALAVLEKINGISKSWWGIRYETNILKELQFKDTKSYTQEIQANIRRAAVGKPVLDLQLMSESSSITLFVNEILSRMKEYRSSGIEVAIDNGAYESCELIPFHYDHARCVKLYSLMFNRYESVIDQYVMFKEMLSETHDISSYGEDVIGLIRDVGLELEDEEVLAALGEVFPVSEVVGGILEKYTRGDYGAVLEEIANLLHDGSDEVFALIEVYAKSKVYANRLSEESSFYDRLANDFAGVLQCDAKSLGRIDFLLKLCVKFKSEGWAKSLNFHLLSALEEVTNPLEVEAARKVTVVLGRINTPKANSKDCGIIISGQEHQIPLYRRLKYSSGDVGSFDKSQFPVLADYLKIKSRLLMQEGLALEAIGFLINEYLANNVSYRFLPVVAICQEAIDLEKTTPEHYIVCMIALDIYGREINSAFDEPKQEIFEEFMRAHGTHRPSEIYIGKCLGELDGYFLRNICVPAAFDGLREFQSNDEVILERVAILDLLIEAKAPDFEDLRLEKDSVVETLFAEKLRAKIESGKLFVDVQAFEQQRKHHYKALFEEAKSTKGGVLLEHLGEEEGPIKSDDIFEIVEGSALAVAANNKTALLLNIYHSAVKDFALNENFGLDKYLSAEIRHIVFCTQLRACFEKTNLVTSTKEGVYLPNEYWARKYITVNKNICDKIDETLGEFSRKVDEILNEVNERFRVEVYKKESSSIFEFLAYYHRVVKVSELITESTNSDDFFSGLLNYLWELASENAREAQVLINDYLMCAIFDALDQLESDLNHVRSGVAIVELLDEIKMARSLFTKEIELVLNWFRFVGADDSRNLERLGVVIEATMSSFDSIYGHKYPAPIFLQNKSDLLLNYREARALFISIFTALENGCKYGPKGQQVTVDHTQADGQNLIFIKNYLEGYSEAQVSELIAREKSKWTLENSSLTRSEGGSGLYKIYNALAHAAEGFSFDITADSMSFTATIGLRNESFDYRRQLPKA